MGCDSVFFYRIEGAHLSRINRIKLTHGSGPRHIVWSRDGNTLYVVHELSSHVSVLRRKKDGFALLQYISTLLEDCAVASYCGAVRLSSDGKSLYATNRGHDSISVLSVKEDGTLALTKTLPAHGWFPRDLQLMEDGNLLCANQNGGGITLISQEGALLDRLELKGVVCVCPVKG